MQRAFPWMIAGILFTAASVQSAEELVDGIAAQVGDEVVLVSEVLESIADTEQRMRDAGMPDSEIAKLRADGLERMIEEKIIQNEVERLELYATDAEIDEAIEMIAGDNGLTVAQLENSVRATNLPMEEYRAAIKGKIEHQKVLQMSLMSKVQIDKVEVRQLFDERFSDQPEGGVQVHLRHLLIPVGEGTDLTSSCAAVTAAAARVTAGESFEVVASEVSVISPKQGGDIGWLHVESLAGWMSNLVSPLEPGGISKVSQQPFGCNLLKLVERRAFERITYEQTEESLFLEIQQQKLEVEFLSWMEELRKHTYIKRRGYFADAARLDNPSAMPDPSEMDSLFQ